MSDPARLTSSKFARYRDRKRKEGLKLVRLWAPDPNAPGFQDRIDEQLRAARVSSEEREIMDWIEAAMAELVLDPYDDPNDDEPEAADGAANPPR